MKQKNYEKLRILDVGCGNNKYKEEEAKVYGIDVGKTKAVDKIWDAEKEKIPYPDNYFDKVVCNSALQEIADVNRVITEIWRVSKSKARVIITVPYFRSWCAFFEQNKSFFRLDSFGYYTQIYGNWKSTARFKLIKNKFNMIFGEHSKLKFFRILNPVVNLPYLSYILQNYLPIIIPEGLEFELEVVK